jgi:hypothetical protein
LGAAGFLGVGDEFREILDAFFSASASWVVDPHTSGVLLPAIEGGFLLGWWSWDSAEPEREEVPLAPDFSRSRLLSLGAGGDLLRGPWALL